MDMCRNEQIYIILRMCRYIFSYYHTLIGVKYYVKLIHMYYLPIKSSK